jgi:hypothetical protein
MLSLDHLPFRAKDLDRLQAAFEALGFTVSTPGAYTSPDFPEARWANRCVFLRKGWFDLLEELQAEPVASPGGCLFLTDDLDRAHKRLSDLRTGEPYRLERRWDVDEGLPPETFSLFGLRERIAPIGLAVIQHAYPCPDIVTPWLRHENGAQEITGLVFGGAEPGPAARAAGAQLDLSAFEYMPADDFERAFGTCERQIAVRVRVSSIGQTLGALNHRHGAYDWRGTRLVARLGDRLGCPIAFFE